jgi:hypothetical protein
MADQPILVARGSNADHVKKARLLGALVAIGIGLGTFVAGSYLVTEGPGMTSTTARGLPRILALVFGAFGGYLAERFVRPYSGTVTFYEPRIVFSKQKPKGIFDGSCIEHTEQVLWSEVKGFKDASADYVTLVATCGSASFLTVPTPREEDRVAVLKLLDERGIPRLD